KRVTATGLWDTSSEVVCFVCEFLLPAVICAQAIRHHWAIENRSHYVRDGSFREDASRIRCNPGIFARLRSFATNILRFNDVENVSDTRYRITLGGLDALRSLHFMQRELNSPGGEVEDDAMVSLAQKCFAGCL